MRKFLLLFGLVLFASCNNFVKVEEEDQTPSYNWNFFETKVFDFGETGGKLYDDKGFIYAMNLKGEVPVIVPVNSNLTLEKNPGTKANPGDVVVSKGWSLVPGMVMVEDLYPYTGDKDFNDIVFGYMILMDITTTTTYHQNGYSWKNVVDTMNVYVQPRACGATKKNLAIGMNLKNTQTKSFDFTFDKSKIKEVIGGEEYRDSWTNWHAVDANGVESGNDPIIPLHGDFKAWWGHKDLVNTMNSHNPYNPVNGEDGYVIKITFDDQEEVLSYQIGWEFFAMVDGNRSAEIRVPFGIASEKHTAKTPYVDVEGMAWMMDMAYGDIRYPQEFTSIFDAYPNFMDYLNEQYAWGWDEVFVEDLLYTKKDTRFTMESMLSILENNFPDMYEMILEDME